MENSNAMYRGQAGPKWENLDLDDFLGVKKIGWGKLDEYDFKDIRNEASFNDKYGDPYDYVYITRLRAVYGVIGYLPSLILLAFAIKSVNLDALVCAIVAIAITAMVTVFMAYASFSGASAAVCGASEVSSASSSSFSTGSREITRPPSSRRIRITPCVSRL